jgi:glycosyltransferase involved in cell wall biosynthesis
MNQVIAASVYMITLNEEKNIAESLASVSDFAEIIIVDSGSSDQTLKIAEKFPNVRVFHNDWPGFSEQKAYAMSLCSHPWVFNLDADELPTKEFLQEVRALIAEDTHDALESNRTLIRWGKQPKNFSKNDRLIRFFRKSCGHYEVRRVHESISINGSVKKTQATILHKENLSLSQRFTKSNRYSELKAEDKFEKNQNASLASIVLMFPVTFLQVYLFKGHFLDGLEGFNTSMNAAFYTYMKYAKLREMHQRKVDGL